MHYELKNLDRCDSQELNQLPGNNSVYSEKTEKIVNTNVSAQLSQLLHKIQSINNSNQNKTSPSNLNPNSNPIPVKEQPRSPPISNIRFITKQGKVEDQPHRPTVLNTSRHKKSKHVTERSSPRDMEVQNKYREIESYLDRERDREKEREREKSMGKERDGQQNGFYRYCTQEIVRVATENANLQKNLQKTIQTLQRQKKTSQSLKSQNLTLIKQLTSQKTLLQHTTHQLQTLRLQLQEQQEQKLSQQKQQQAALGQRGKQYEEELSKYRRLLQEREESQARLVGELKGLRLERLGVAELAEENRRLGRRVGELVAENRGLRDKVVGKTQAVDYLWGIKQIEYANIVQLIQLSKSPPPPSPIPHKH